MTAREFIKDLTGNYFYERDQIRRSSRRCWGFIFVVFTAFFLLQIYGALVNWGVTVTYRALDGSGGFDSDSLWRHYRTAIFFQAVVLLGVFVHFVAAQFRGKWFIRFGEVGDFIALAAFCRHFQWTHELYPLGSDPYICSSAPVLAGVPTPSATLIFLFCLGLAFCKVVVVLVLAWKVIRK
jgi:hypothetical protein